MEYYRILADGAVIVHLLFIVFVVGGGVLVWRWPMVAFAHVPAFVWGVMIEFGGWICPLTYLENDLRRSARAAGYEGGFVEHYIVPVIYPELLFPGGFPAAGFMVIGLFVLLLNLAIYWRLWRRRLKPPRPRVR